MLTRRIDDLNTLLTTPHTNSLAELYHENSKLRRTNSRQYGEFISLIGQVPYLIEKMTHPYKMYPTADRIALPAEAHAGSGTGVSIEQIIQERRTVRQFTGQPITIEQLAKLLHFTYGITCETAIETLSKETVRFRAAPSAGALYPLELYLIAWKTLGLQPGIYHYCILNHSLERLREGDFARLAAQNALSDEITDTACGLFLVSAMFQRTMLKYNERGYRFALIEAGHLAQNMCLMACAMKLGILPIGGFLDDELNRMLGLDGINETVVYPLAVGTVEDPASGRADRQQPFADQHM